MTTDEAKVIIEEAGGSVSSCGLVTYKGANSVPISQALELLAENDYCLSGVEITWPEPIPTTNKSLMSFVEAERKIKQQLVIKLLNETNLSIGSIHKLEKEGFSLSDLLKEKTWINSNNNILIDEFIKELRKRLSVLKEKNNKTILTDSVNSPSHYTDGKIEVIEYIEAKKLGYCLGNAVKYISRAGKKDPAKRIEDLEKAQWYLKREVQRLTDEEANK